MGPNSFPIMQFAHEKMVVIMNKGKYTRMMHAAKECGIKHMTCTTGLGRGVGKLS